MSIWIKNINLNVCYFLSLPVSHTRLDSQRTSSQSTNKKFVFTQLKFTQSLYYLYISHYMYCTGIFELFVCCPLVAKTNLMGCLFVSTFQIGNSIKFNTILFYALLARCSKGREIRFYVCLCASIYYLYYYTEWSDLDFISVFFFSRIKFWRSMVSLFRHQRFNDWNWFLCILKNDSIWIATPQKIETIQKNGQKPIFEYSPARILR